LSDDLQRLVEQVERDALLFDPDQLRRRIEMLDLLDACFPDVLSRVANAESGDSANAVDLHRRAQDLRDRLEAANESVYEGLRAEIRRGGMPKSLLGWARVAAGDEDAGRAGGLGYGFLDELISGVFRFEDPGSECALNEPEMVPYQPTPARHIFNLIEAAELAATDVLIDIGSGLGHVPLLVSICTPAQAIGIELEASNVERARQCASALNLCRVAFVQQDVRQADLSTGTVFYLYTPFTGSILRSVLDRLRSEARRRRIRICSYGPCTPVIAGEPWLENTALPATDRIVLFRSR
jgi:hypothetical protein